MVYYIIVERRTRWHLPVADSGTPATEVSPTDNKPPRLFLTPGYAKAALTAYCKWRLRRVTREYVTDFGTITRKVLEGDPTTTRDPKDFEIIPVQVVQTNLLVEGTNYCSVNGK